MRRVHSVPLSRQALDIIAGIESDAALSQFLFPSLRSVHHPMSENTINAALRRMGYAQDEMTGYGFRATASTLLNEMGKWNPDAIERQLAHAEENSVRRAYTGMQTTRLALQIAPHVLARPGELRKAEWQEIDFGAAVWRIPANKIKARRPHAVPLSEQVIAYLKELERLTGDEKYLFPAAGKKNVPVLCQSLNS